MLCRVCERELNRAQWSKDETLKSCPHCSTKDGDQHVFFKYPQNFGTTPLRATPNHPEGPQSYCTECRADSVADLRHAIYCKDVDIK